MIDVINDIKPLLKFDSDDDFYLLQILQRKKENPHLGSNSRVIKSYFIDNIDYLNKIYPEVKMLCNMFNARAALRLNKRSYKKVAFKTLQNIANTMSNGNFKHIHKQCLKACGDGHNDKNKKWIIDIDTRDIDYFKEVVNFINNIKPDGDKIITTLLTKNGVHVITKPFDLKEFKDKFKDVDVHKDNPINLYIP